MSLTTTAEPTASKAPTSIRQALPALIALSLAMLVEMVDNSLLNVALPTIGRELGAGATSLQWFVGAYSLAFGSLLMLGGTFGDRFGRRRTILIGLALFGLVGLAVLAVQEPWELIVLRALGGGIAAFIAPITGSLIFTLFDDDELRRRGIGIIMTVAIIGGAAGPILAGLALEAFPWQALLVVNAPIAALAFAGIYFGIPRDDASKLTSGRVDIFGAVLSITGLAAALYTFTLATQNGVFAWPTLTSALIAVIALTWFFRHESRTENPLLDPALLKIPTISGSILLQVGGMLAMVAVSFISSQLFQFAWGWSPLMAGLGTLPLILGMMLADPVVEGSIKRFGQRRAAIMGSATVIVALLVVTWALNVGYWPMVPAFLLLAVGMRTIMTTCTVALLNALPAENVSVGQAMTDTAQEIGNAVGVAVVGTAVAALFGHTFPEGAWSVEDVASYDHAIVVALAVIIGIVVVVSALGARTLTNSTEVEEH